MGDTSQVEMLHISSLNALEYCPRKFYYQIVQGEMMVNEFVLEGTLAQRRVDLAGTPMVGVGEVEIQTRQLYLSSEALHLTGFADVVEERGGVLVPVEYRHGQEGNWLNDHIQLCAQALCLEERQPGKPPIPHGYVYYVDSRRRVQVRFTQQLRARTRTAISQAMQVAELEAPPPPLTGTMAARCPHCSLLPLCMPEEVRMLQKQQ